MNDSSTVTCPNCGAKRPASIPRCSNCGDGKNPGLRCPRCGAFTGPGASKCEACGHDLNVGAPRKKSVLWLLLFLFLGIPAGCLGGCFLLVGVGGDSGTLPLIPFGVLLLGAFVSLLWLLVRKSKS